MNMKRKSLILFGMVIALCLLSNSVSANNEKNIYAPYTSFEEVSMAYYQAVEEYRNDEKTILLSC